MKIKYEFADGTVSEVEVDESIGTVIVEERRVRGQPCPEGAVSLLFNGCHRV